MSASLSANHKTIAGKGYHPDLLTVLVVFSWLAF
jgi:hypothetical protein